MTKTTRIVVELVVGAILFLGQALHLEGQSNVSFQYFYGDLGQLTKVVDSTGTVIEYVYDPVGNILQVKRSSIAPSTLAVFNFTPQRGGAGQTVTVQGQAFDPTPVNNIVQFNDTPATVLSASATTLVATVPAAATTGPISVTVSGQTATSSTNFTVLPLPVVTSLSRKSGLFNTSFSNVLATGINFSGASFAFQPPGIVVISAAVDPSGTSVVLALKVGGLAGTFALVATNAAGSSSAIPSPTNRFTVVNPLSTAISASGIPDVIDAVFGADPLDPNSVPVLPSAVGQAESPAFTVLNRNASRKPASFQAESPAFAVLNASSQPGTPRTFQAESPGFVVLNSNASGSKKSTSFAESPAFTVQNSNATQPGTQTFAAEGPLFSLLNGSASTTHAFAAESSLFSLLNSHISSLTPKGAIAAQSLLFPSQQAASVPARVQTLRGKKLWLIGSAKKATARKTKTRSPATAANKKPGIPSLGLASPETEMKSNYQQGVIHDSQHK